VFNHVVEPNSYLNSPPPRKNQTHGFKYTIMSSESRFQISVPDDAIALLRRKLADAHFPDEVSDAGWDSGPPLSDMKRLVDRWKNDCD
jgi:epoxide hydrolase-like protein